MGEILDRFKDFNEIKKMSLKELDEFSGEIREFLIENVSKTGGHLASNLGVVELTLSLYNVFDFNNDKLIWDVGHQAYVHKILTGRKDRFPTLRKYGGMSGFPKTCESVYDMFETGHSSTSISAAIGMARARDLNKEDYNVIAVIGDGALTGGMALEAMNDVGYRKTKLIIILNDNQMSIGKNVGGLSTYLSKIRIDPKYNKLKDDIEDGLRRIPNIGKGMADSIKKLKNSVKQLLVPGMFFEDMGIKYLGPIDGHNIKELSKVLSMAKSFKDPVIIHVITKKGKGYEHAEKNPNKFHGIGPFDCDSGEVCATSCSTYSSVFGEELTNIAKEDKRIVAITAAMKDGTGLNKFAQSFPDRFFDVGIAEQHAVTFAAGLTKGGLRPVFAVYSTFLQRGYDQVLHDVCLQKLPVIFAIDRAGIVGEDGETHQGVFDLSYLSHIPNITIMSPKCTDELKIMLRWAFNQEYPIAIRYPRGGDNNNVKLSPIKYMEKGKWEILYGGLDSSNCNIALIATGKMVQKAVLVRENLKKYNINVSVVNACFIKPIDKVLLSDLSHRGFNIITIEDNVKIGGLGSLILQYLNEIGSNSDIINLGFRDEFIPHGNIEILYKLHGLDVNSISETVLKLYNNYE